MTTKTILTGLCVLALLPAAAQNVSIEPGQLSDRLTSLTPERLLTIEGRGDARDINALRSISPEVETLDLTNLSIRELQAPSPVHLGKSMFKEGHLPSYMLFQTRFKKVILPADLTVIESGAFAGSDIESIEIPEGVTSIGDYAFYGCHGLKSVKLPSTLLNLGRGAFADCPALYSVNIAATRLATLPEECFSGDFSLRALDAPAIRTIETRALAGTSIESLDLPSVQTLAPYALADMNYLVFLSVGPNAKFDTGALMNCHSLMTLQGVPADLPDLFAANCYNLAPEVILNDAVSVGKYSVANSRSYAMVLGPNLTSIDENAFKGAVNLSHIDATYLEDNIPAVDSTSFAGIEPSMVKLKVSDGDEDLWKSHPVWGQFDVYSDASTGVDEISPDAPSGIRVLISGTTLTVEAPQPIVAGSIYDISGHRLLDLPSGENAASVDISELPHGVSIVSVRTADDFKGIKIML